MDDSQAECLKMSRNQTNYCCTQTAAYYSTYSRIDTTACKLCRTELWKDGFKAVRWKLKVSIFKKQKLNSRYNPENPKD